MGRISDKLSRQQYDRFTRDRDSRRFYQSQSWQKTRQLKLAASPLCETCLQNGITKKADVVHHTVSVKKGTHNLTIEYLISLCHACHNAIESEIEKDAAKLLI